MNGPGRRHEPARDVLTPPPLPARTLPRAEPPPLDEVDPVTDPGLERREAREMVRQARQERHAREAQVEPDPPPPSGPIASAVATAGQRLERVVGVRVASTILFLVWLPAVWKFGLPMEWALAGAAAIGVHIVSDTARPSGTVRPPRS